MTDFQKGQTVTFAESTTGSRASGFGSSKNFVRGDSAEVSAVRKSTITVRVPNPSYGQTTPGYGRDTTKTYSYNVARSSLRTPNGEAWNEVTKPKPRKLGEPPEGGISPDDPRLAWLWEDAAKVANRSGYCGYYDRIAGELNIPGRKRAVSVSLKHNGIQITATVQARSRKEAERLVREKLELAPSA